MKRRAKDPGPAGADTNSHASIPSETLHQYQDTARRSTQSSTQILDSSHDQETGNVTADVAGIKPGRVELARELFARLSKEGRWFGQVESVRDDMLKDARSRGLSKAAAQEWVYAELDRLYPPLSQPPGVGAEVFRPTNGGAAGNTEKTSSNRIEGLGDIPAGWPALADSAPLQVELSWVQSNRLLIVEEKPTGATVVRLALAKGPAPSRSALGWLETSIRTYAKYVDVCSRVLAGEAEAEESHRRERLALAEIRELLCSYVR